MNIEPRTLCIVGALVAVAPSALHAEELMEESDVEEREEDARFTDVDSETWSVTSPVTVGLRAGGFAGDDYRRAAGGVTELEAEVEPTVERGRFRLQAPLELEYRETYGADLRSIDGEAGLEGRWKVTDNLQIEPALELERMWRPGWDDLYQPIPATPSDPPTSPDEFQSTNRYGFFSWELGAAVEFDFADVQSVELDYEFDVTTYDKDPNFRSIADVDPEPTHLVPYDNRAHEVSAWWEYAPQGWEVGAGLDLTYKEYLYVFARDAGTGLTHAGPGGPPPNPLYRTLEYEPGIEGELELVDGHLTLEAALGWIIQNDLYRGYYSYQAPHPELGAEWEFDGGTEVGVDADLEWRRYGPNSYAATPGWQPGDSGHPPLQYGDRRVDHRIGLGFDAETPIVGELMGTLEADLKWRDTNFPDYEMGVFPRTRNYDIEWSYTNFQILAGVEYEFF